MKLFPPKVEKDWKFDVAWCIFLCWQLSPKLLHDEPCWGQPHNRCNPTNQKFHLKGRLVEWRFSRSSVGKISNDVRGQKHRRFFRCFLFGAKGIFSTWKTTQKIELSRKSFEPPVFFFFEKNAFIYLPKFLGEEKMQIFFLPLHIQPYLLDTFRANGFCRFLEKGEGRNEQKQYYIIYKKKA